MTNMEEVETTTTSSGTEDYVDRGEFWKVECRALRRRVKRLEDHQALTVLIVIGAIIFLRLMA